MIVLIYDARGNGGGDVSPTITGDHQNRITDYTAIVVETDGEDENKQGRVLDDRREDGTDICAA